MKDVKEYETERRRKITFHFIKIEYKNKKHKNNILIFYNTLIK